MKKAFSFFFLLPILLSCAPEGDFYPFGEKPNEDLPYHLYRAEEKEGENYEDYLTRLSESLAKKRLLAGESLYLVFEKESCPACASFLPTFKKLYPLLGVETFGMSLSDGQLLAKEMGYEDTKFGHYTPTLYLAKEDGLSSVLFPETGNQTILLNTVKTAMGNYQSPYNAYRYEDLSSFEGKIDQNSLFYYLDLEDEENASFYKTSFLPYLEKSTQKSIVLDVTSFEESEKATAKALFLDGETLKPLRKGETRKSLVEGEAYLSSLL